MVLSDGRAWVTHNREALKTRFKDSGKITTVILLHPESDMLSVAFKKKGVSSVDAYREKIVSTIKDLIEINKNGSALEICGHRLTNCFSVVLNDNYAVFFPYFLSDETRHPPVFVFRKGKKSQEECSFYYKASKDFDRLKELSEDITKFIS